MIDPKNICKFQYIYFNIATIYTLITHSRLLSHFSFLKGIKRGREKQGFKYASSQILDRQNYKIIRNQIRPDDQI